MEICTSIWRGLALSATPVLLLALGSCGGGTAASTESDGDSGINKTYLSVEVADADGDSLTYHWRVTAGSVENRNARETVWTMPEGDGLHFAYVVVSDGRGGWVEQQYAVSTDLLDIDKPGRTAIDRPAPAVVNDFAGATTRLRFASPDATDFEPPGGGLKQARTVFLPDVQVQIVEKTPARTVVFAGTTNLRGELDVPKLPAANVYDVMCTPESGAPMTQCLTLVPGTVASLLPATPALTAVHNLRLFGHVALADGAGCGNENEFFKIRTAATVRLRLKADNTALTTPIHVNRWGDYQLSAAVPARGALLLEIQCEGYLVSLDVRAAPDPEGYIATVPIELSHPIPNQRPRVVKMVASGPDGNVRGRMIEPGEGTGSNFLPGSDHFLTFKGIDTKLSACLYYRALGAVAGCDAQGNPNGAISFADWKRKNEFGTAADVAADYINQRDLNLVRRMVGTRSSSGGIAFYVCNSPGPDRQTQAEIDDTMNDALANQKRVACVAMEYTPVTNANNDRPFTKFFTFGPEGDLLLSINLDGRGEKFMPGSCVACHGGTTYNGRFPEQQTASPFLGARFLPFDTGNYLFSSKQALSEAAQSEAFYQLNRLVVATEPNPSNCSSDPKATDACTPTTLLVNGWYADGHVLDKFYIAPEWKKDGLPPDASRFYRDVIGISCRTCHVALGRPSIDWESTILSPDLAETQFCGGTKNVAVNASMPQALFSSDRLLDRIRADPSLAALTTQFLGCSEPRPDPVYPKRQ